MARIMEAKEIAHNHTVIQVVGPRYSTQKFIHFPPEHYHSCKVLDKLNMYHLFIY